MSKYKRNKEKDSINCKKYYQKNREKILNHNRDRTRTFEYYLRRKYLNMHHRSRNEKYPHIKIEELCSRKEFMGFGRNSEEYKRLHREWVSSGYNKKLSPSIDRINCNRGYSLDNIQFITQTENISKCLREYPRGGYGKKKVLIEKDGASTCFISLAAAGIFLKTSSSQISEAIRRSWRVRGWTPTFIKEIK